MRYYKPPAIRDDALLDALTTTSKIACKSRLFRRATMLKMAYLNYVARSGDSSRIARTPMSKGLKRALLTLYMHPPLALRFLRDWRASNEFKVCAMCGSEHSSTLDHVLPKEHFPEFSIFSLNLVPACKCNLKRGAVYSGANGERILHPYFDQLLSQRLIGCEFSQLGSVAKVRAVPLLPRNDPEFSNLEFHLASVILKSGLERFLRERWIALVRRPRNVVRSLSNTPANLGDLASTLLSERDILDDYYGSVNNWNSIFISGLLGATTLPWLYDALRTPGRGVDTPLI